MEEIPARSRDLIDMLADMHKPRVVTVDRLTTEEARLRLAIEQGKIELAQQLKRLLDKKEAS